MIAVILSAGSDTLLLSTRNAVLTQAGYLVVSAQTAQEVIEKFRHGIFDLVLLCHSMPIRDRERIAKVIHQRSPSTKIVVVGLEAAMGTSADSFVHRDPAIMLEELPTMLSRRTV